jgi:pimeloyl-ACP methyl ester carboxylesterase
LNMTNSTAVGMPEPQFATVDGLRIRYLKNEKKTGDPVLLLSPWPESIYAFLPTWETFSDLGPVTAVDLPAFGHSESRPDVRAPERMGEFVISVLQALELDRPFVIAPDVGTPAILFAAANHPDAFRGLVIGSGATNHTDIGGVLKELVNAPSPEQFKDLTGEQFVRGAIEDIKNYKLPDYVLQDYLASYAGPRLFDSIEYVRDYPQSLPRLARRLGEIKVPCQITVGRNDPFVPVSNAKALHRGLPKSKLDILDCSHFAWEDAASQYGKLACDFINGGYTKL